jgi:hypothetical protein
MGEGGQVSRWRRQPWRPCTSELNFVLGAMKKKKGSPRAQGPQNQRVFPFCCLTLTHVPPKANSGLGNHNGRSPSSLESVVVEACDLPRAGRDESGIGEEVTTCPVASLCGYPGASGTDGRSRVSRKGWNKGRFEDEVLEHGLGGCPPLNRPRLSNLQLRTRLLPLLNAYTP